MNKKITIYDIAKIAGVSPTTVSRVIHHTENVKESTRQKVWLAFKQANITPDELSLKASQNISVSNANGFHLKTPLNACYLQSFAEKIP